MNHDAEKEPSLFECNKVDAAKNGGPTFLVPECDSSRELAAFAGELEEAIAQKPQKIILNFVGMMTMSSDAVLLLHDVLCQRSPETKLVVKARSPPPRQCNLAVVGRGRTPHPPHRLDAL